MSVQKQDGTAQNGVGFLAVRDGMVATAWHIVRDAKRVVARFPSGDEFQCTGVIDKDETRNVALVRIKVFGRPLLKLSAADSPAGANLFVAGVKDTAFGLLPVTVAEPASKDGSKWAILNGDVPIGNSGAPLLNSEGEVVGLLTLRQIEGKVVPTMIPAGFILALDNSLPTEPWAQIPVSQPVPTPTPAKPEANAGNDAVDALLGNALLILSDNMDIIDWADVVDQGLRFQERRSEAGLRFSAGSGYHRRQGRRDPDRRCAAAESDQIGTAGACIPKVEQRELHPFGRRRTANRHLEVRRRRMHSAGRRFFERALKKTGRNEPEVAESRADIGEVQRATVPQAQISFDAGEGTWWIPPLSPGLCAATVLYAG
ncbi:MAG: trypsin-like peptidase domain-containing protein [Acidobacteria bacterium]|nr:trypsin-like peptidase domain-containing protein [Acidobacteriota bacterium]